MFARVDSCFGRLVSHKALLSCQNPIVNETHAINQWSAVDGINVIYFVNLSHRMIKLQIHTTIARIGRLNESLVAR